MINYFLGTLIAFSMLWALCKIIKDFSSGGCGCGCSGCAVSKSCPSSASGRDAAQ